MRLDSNGLVGELPTAATVWPALSQLEYLNLNNNKGIRGGVPPSLSSLTNLRRLYLSAIGLDGAVPEALAQLRKLQDLFLDHNHLTGRLPALGYSQYDDCGLAQNQFTCPLPVGASGYCQATCV